MIVILEKDHIKMQAIISDGLNSCFIFHFFFNAGCYFYT